MKRIAVIGAGWLGLPLAQCLANLGHNVVATRTSKQGCEQLAASNVEIQPLNLADSAETIDATLSDIKADIIIGCFPPGFRKGCGDEYAHHWQKLVKAAKNCGVQKVVMISSTTVYPNLAQDMTESSASLALAQNNSDFSDNARIMLSAEQSLTDSGLDFAIIRCSGLIGPERHPSRFVAKLRQVSDLAPANMLHLNDAIGITVFATLNVNRKVINATTPNTTNKAEFYQTALERAQSNDALPKIVHQADKKILANKAIALGYRFHFQHTLETI